MIKCVYGVIIKQYCGTGFRFETTPERCFGNEIQSIWGSCKIFKRKMIGLLDHFAEDSTERLFIFVMLTKCCIFCNQNGICDFC